MSPGILGPGGRYQTIKSNGTSVAQRAILDLVAGAGIVVNVTDDPLNDQTVVTVSRSSGAYSLPSDRLAVWNPGLNAVGGIPTNRPVNVTLSPSGADDTSTINAALAACPSGQCVQLTTGVFKIGDGTGITVTKSNVTLRGSGPGPGTWAAGTAASGSGGTYLVAPVQTSPVITFGGGDAGTAINLTADVAKGSNQATVASTAGLAVGMLVLITQFNGKTTIAAGSNGVNTSTFTAGSPGTLHVASIANFQGSGWLDVPVSGTTANQGTQEPNHSVISYTSVTGGADPTFNGCVKISGQTGAMATGSMILDTTLAHWPTQDPPNDNGWFELPNRPLGETMQITAINGNVITFSTAFPIAYYVGQAAQLSPFASLTEYSGVEEVYMYGGYQGGSVVMWSAAHCWVKHCETTWSSGCTVEMVQSLGCEVRDSYMHDSPAGMNAGGGSYGIGVDQYSSNCLIENNIIIRLNKGCVYRSAGGGNVFGYNYVDDIADNNGSWFETTVNSSHMTTPHYELFEGNEAANFDQDDRWGNSIYITIFRNQFTGFLRDFTADPSRAAGFTQWHWWQSFVGNVLGTSPLNSVYVGTPSSHYELIGSEQNDYMWLLAYHSSVNETSDDVGKSLSTHIRDGNFDYVTGEVHWHGVGGQGINNGLSAPANNTLPTSLYLSGKPTFFGSNVWPWVDGSNAANPLPGHLPARVRFDAGTPNTLS